jgi:hypothetical protein
MGKRGKLEPAAMQLYAEGREIPEISQMIGVSENSLRDWKNRAGDEWDEARGGLRHDVRSRLDMLSAATRMAEAVSAASGSSATMLKGTVCLIQEKIFRVLERDLVGDNDPDAVARLTRAVYALAKATANIEEFVAEARKQALIDAADKVGETAKQAGVSAETIQMIRRDVLMMAT